MFFLLIIHRTPPSSNTNLILIEKNKTFDPEMKKIRLEKRLILDTIKTHRNSEHKILMSPANKNHTLFSPTSNSLIRSRHQKLSLTPISYPKSVSPKKRNEKPLARSFFSKMPKYCKSNFFLLSIIDYNLFEEILILFFCITFFNFLS